MQISCDCGNFKAELLAFPKNTPGRLACYCDDCQTYLHRLGRADLLDEYGGTQVIPAYPSEIKILQGNEFLQCNRLAERGLSRWSVTCCNTPILNVPAAIPWAGILHQTFTREDPDYLDTLGQIRSRIFGKFAKAGAPFKISEKMTFSDMLVVLPFILKGKLFKKGAQSPFTQADGKTPVSKPVILPEA